MKNIKYLEEQIKALKPQERAELDMRLLQMLGDDADRYAKDYEVEISSDYIEPARELVKQWGKVQGMSSGYPSLDKLTRGFVGGEVTVVAGPTSNGKTALAVNIAAKVARTGVPVLFVTLEMSKPILTSRLLYADSDFEDYAALVGFQKRDTLDWRSIDGLVENAIKNLGVQLVIIDHLHYFTRELEQVSEDLGRITKEFKKNAIRHNIPIILISHIRRTSNQPGIDDLRGSSYIAQDADVVLMIRKHPEHDNRIAVMCLKNRNRGMPEKNEIVFEFDKTKISELLNSSPW